MAGVKHTVLLVIDCLRADHVSCYGYDKPTTPTLDALAADGYRWAQMRSTSSWTKPSVASMFTGLYPTQHGAFRGIKRSKKRAVATSDIVRGTAQTLAESFRAAGWRTAAFANNAQLDEYTGLNRGFETYLPRAGKADSIIKAYQAWLSDAPQTPSMAYLHFLEAHWPYKPRRRHIAMFGGDRDANVFSNYSARDYARLRKDVAAGATLPEGHLCEMLQMYDGAVRRLDGKIKLVLRAMEEAGIRDESALFVTADHGEEFLDHGSIGHGHSLYDELTRVPLIVQVPGRVTPEVFHEPASHVDLGRTMLCTAGIQSDFPGYDLLDEGVGRSDAVSELQIRERITQSLQSGTWKLIEQRDPAEATETGSRIELYDLAKDPHELINLATDVKGGSVAGKLSAQLATWREHAMADAEKSRVEIDDMVMKRIRDLGYI